MSLDTRCRGLLRTRNLFLQIIGVFIRIFPSLRIMMVVVIFWVFAGAGQFLFWAGRLRRLWPGSRSLCSTLAPRAEPTCNTACNWASIALCLELGDIHWRFLSLVSWRFPPSLQIVTGRSRTASVHPSQYPVVDQSYQRMLQLVIDCRVSTMIYIYNHTTHNTAVSTSTCARCNGS